MNISLAVLATAIGATLFFTVGCTRNRQYRTSFAPCDAGEAGADCTNAVIETTADYKLGYVEFDDQGWFWDRRQLAAVEQLVRTEAGIGQPTVRKELSSSSSCMAGRTTLDPTIRMWRCFALR
jgi:hypothetical protein